MRGSLVKKKKKGGSVNTTEQLAGRQRKKEK